MIKRIDLHIHTSYSDGTCSPEEIFQLAQIENIASLSITDHDTMAAHDEALLLAKSYEIEYIPGIELSTDFHGREIHILGYYVDPKNEALQKQLKLFVQSREQRNARLLALLNEKGFELP